MTVARGSPINIEVNPLKPFPLYEAVCIMRCLAFKNTDPAKYKALMALEPHTEARRATGRSATHYKNTYVHKNVSFSKRRMPLKLPTVKCGCS